MTEFIIITTTGTLTVDGERWTRSGDDVYVYPDRSEGADPVAEVDGREFVGIFDRESGSYTTPADN